MNHLLTQAQSPFLDAAAQYWATSGPSGGSPYSVTLSLPATAAAGTSISVTSGTVPSTEVGATVIANTAIPLGTTITAATGSTVQLSAATTNSSLLSQPTTILPPYPAPWNNYLTFNWLAGFATQPQSADVSAGTLYTRGVVTNGSNQITGLLSTTGLSNGENIQGLGVPAGATIIGISGSTVTMSANGTANAAGTQKMILFQPWTPKIEQYHVGNSPGPIGSPYPVCSGGYTDPGRGTTCRYWDATYTNFKAIFPYNSNVSWQPGDTFLVDTAVYTDIDTNTLNTIYLPPTIATYCLANIPWTEDDNIAICPASAFTAYSFSTPAVGDYVSDHAHAEYLAPDTTILATSIGGVCTPTGSCTSNKGATCPSGDACLFLSRNFVGPTGTITGDQITTIRSPSNVTIAGVTTNDASGVPTRPIQEMGWNGAGGLGNSQFMIGDATGFGVTSGLLIQNIDFKVPLLDAAPQSRAVLDVLPGLSGTNEIKQSRILDGFNELNALNTFSNGGGDGIIGGNAPAAELVTITGPLTTGEQIVAYLWDYGYQVTLTATVASGDTTTTLADKLVQSWTSQGYYTNWPIPAGGSLSWAVRSAANVFYAWGLDGSPVTHLMWAKSLNSAGTAPGSETVTVTPCCYYDGMIDSAGDTGTLLIDQDEFAYNGGYTGPAHGIYVGDNKDWTLKVTNSWFHDTWVGFHIKSRVGTTILDNDYFESGYPTASNGGPTDQYGESAAIDTPCGGAVTIANSILTKAVVDPHQTEASGVNIWRSNEDPACQAYPTNSIDFHNNTVVELSPYPDYTNPTDALWLNTLDLGKDTIASSSCPGATIFAGDNIVEWPTTTNCSYPPGGGSSITIASELSIHPYGKLVDTTASATIPSGSFGITTDASYSPVSQGGRACPSGDTCYFMSQVATAASGAGGDTVDILDQTPSLPGDPGWTSLFNTANSWSFKNNLFMGFVPNLGTQDVQTNGPNSALYFSNFPWYGTMPTGANGSVGINASIGPAELRENFSPTTNYAPAGDNSAIGTDAYQHAAQPAVVRALPIIGAED